MNTNRIKVFIISHQVLFRQGVELSLSSVSDIEISGDADFNNGVPFNIDNMPPDVTIIDIDAPSDAGLTMARTIKQRLPSIGIIMVTSTLNSGQFFTALKFQAAACVSKEIIPDQLIDMVRRVARGEHPINESLVTQPSVAEQVLQQFQELSWRSEAEDIISPLTPRETEILNYVAQGYLNKQIAFQLGISEQTIKNHVTSILRKLNANARTEAVVKAVKQGLVSLDYAKQGIVSLN
ncbi:LuxR C-terminal-related transcriptional regulator [Chloroflexota bacterium]